MAGTGLKRETAAALCTLLGPTLVVPVLFILLEKDEFVRFWAMQALVTFGILWVASFILGFMYFLHGLVTLLIFVFVLVFTYKAWKGDRWEAPLVGNLSKQLLGKMK